jgi:2-oxoglutarate dehydrogenase E1 component
MDKFSYLSNGDVSAIEDLYKNYQQNPDSVDIEWKKFFEGFEFSLAKYGEDFINAASCEPIEKEFKIVNLINDYRSRGHLFTQTNPVRARRTYSPTLDISNYGLTDEDLEQTFQAGSEIGIGPAKLKDIIAHLQETYCRSIGVEYMYIRKPEVLNWIKNKIEPTKNQPDFTIEEKKEILTKLTKAVGFEGFLHKRFVGQKRFSLEGGEALIPALYAVLKFGYKLGVQEFVLGMAHRGRLNVLANIFGKEPHQIFSEFEGKEYEDELFDGDVKYHLGYSTHLDARDGGKVHLTLAPNPSHLEAVDPIVEGMVRAKIDNYLNDESKIVPILIHGDAAVAGQGIVYEVLQMAHLDGYKTGGTVHIVINNQIGFTTNYVDARSSIYCTDIAKVTLSPVFHVNGDDVEAVVHTIKIAMEFRQQYKRDVFVDLLCYRKYGHNEGDEPRFTQPLLYKAIAKHPNPREIYAKKLLESNTISKEEIDKIDIDFQDFLDKELGKAKDITHAQIRHFMNYTWRGLENAKEGDFDKSPETGVSKKILLDLAKKFTTLPKDKKFFKKIEKLIEDRRKMIFDDGIADWALAEHFAYSTLLNEGHNVRISGQDVERGTFSHRHAVIKLEDSEEEYTPLNETADKAKFYIYNSHLSEYGVLGFDYGYAMASPNSLVIWEAQFGDFNNGAQIIIDQFLSSAEDKWNCMNGLVMLLPHGYEGQGAEHSSARLERFLQLSAEENMQVVNCTTPANFYHALRRQLKRKFRVPLIVMSPKSLLRHPLCVSPIDDFAKGGFQELLDDPFVKDPKKIDTLVFCSGKIYYDLIERRVESAKHTFAIIRLEQLYPLPINQIEAVISKYKGAKRKIWFQEEPLNMGAWTYMLRHLRHLNLEEIGLHDSASPATGSSKRHAQRHERILSLLFGPKKN